MNLLVSYEFSVVNRLICLFILSYGKPSQNLIKICKLNTSVSITVDFLITVYWFCCIKEKKAEVLLVGMGIKCVFPVMNAIILLWWNCHFISSKPSLVAISERCIGSKNVSLLNNEIQGSL